MYLGIYTAKLSIRVTHFAERGERLLKRMKYIIGFLLLSIMLPAIVRAAEFTDDDIGKLLLLREKTSFAAANSFLVLEAVGSDGGLECRIFGSSPKYEVSRAQIDLLPFYETVTPLTITQYALYTYAHGNPRSWEVRLARLIGDTTGRMAVVAEFETAGSNFLRKLNAAGQKRHLENLEAEDYEDLLHDLLDEDTMYDSVKRATAARDWVLGIALFEAYRNTIRQFSNQLFPTPRAREEGMAALAARETEQVTAFAQHARQSNTRQDRFRKLFPRAHGLWSETPPAHYDGLRQVFDRSLKSFVKLDELSKLTEPQEWGSAMLDVLLTIEGSPGAAELEKEFDETIRYEEKRRR